MLCWIVLVETGRGSRLTGGCCYWVLLTDGITLQVVQIFINYEITHLCLHRPPALKYRVVSGKHTMATGGLRKLQRNPRGGILILMQILMPVWILYIRHYVCFFQHLSTNLWSGGNNRVAIEIYLSLSFLKTLSKVLVCCKTFAG